MLAGKEDTFWALGVTTKKRGLYYAAPVWTKEPAGSVNADAVGVVKMGVDVIDTFMDNLH